MSNSLIGQVGIYDENSEKFESYIKRMDLFFKANNIASSRQSACFLSMIGPKLFQQVSDLISPREPDDCSYTELVATLKAHFKPHTIQIYERYKFFKRDQQGTESIKDFIGALKGLAATCNFGDKLEEQLLDRFVVGLRDEATQRTLLAIDKLDYATAVATATAREEAAKDVQEMNAKSANSSSGTNVIKPKGNKSAKPKFHSNNSKPQSNSNSSSSNISCYSCGGNHVRTNCRFRNASCNYCHKQGHIVSVCKQKGRTQKNSNNSNNRANTVKQNPVPVQVCNSSVPPEYIFHSETEPPIMLSL